MTPIGRSPAAATPEIAAAVPRHGTAGLRQLLHTDDVALPTRGIVHHAGGHRCIFDSPQVPTARRCRDVTLRGCCFR